MSESEMRACAEKLASIRDEINALINFIGDRHFVSGPDRTRAREMLTNLKRRLEGEYRRTSTIKGHASLNQIEKAYYAPAVHKASASFQVRTNSIPGATWISDLYSARIDITFPLDQLYEQLETREGSRRQN